MTALHEILRGDAPLVVDVPHAGTFVPPALRERFTTIACTVPDTDWHVEKLYDFVSATGATLVVATHSRYAIDLNRDPAGVALYAGTDNTELCPLRTFANEPIYRDAGPSADEIEARTRSWFVPYHTALAAEIRRVQARHGYAVLLDGHSVPAVVPRLFAGRLPDLNLGTVDGTSCDAGLEAVAARVVSEATSFTSTVNGRFKGGWITRRHGDPRGGVHALQLEMVQAGYMDEAPPYRWDRARAAALGAVLERLVAALLAWRPGR
ncbi:MAG: N-formylglutamate deformylase [Burkholderiales bacterium]|nr:N-formylglutamate deformylase [Burkholderiales bacterium]